ncbi:hypothetical protein F2Q68_00040023 [Brassica cretica]|uniref:Uncharacterized protein n=1 Tax=Brassica cretica TaxID=69181 RepID=A0A8S9MAT9_BRACR|nr:hypothetical protein F2Q68_00040023 [Brassica cretica]
MNSSRPSSLVIPPAPILDPVNIESSREDLVRESSDRETAEPSVTDGNRKKRSASGSSASTEAHTWTESDEPPKKKKKKEKKKRKKPVEERSEPSRDVGGRELVTHDGYSCDVVAQASGDHAIEGSNEPTGRGLWGSPVQERGDLSGVKRTEYASELTTAPAVPNLAPAAVNLTVREESSTPALGVGDGDPTLLPAEDGTGLDSENLVELSDSSDEGDGGDKSNEQVPASNLLGTEEDLGSLRLKNKATSMKLRIHLIRQQVGLKKPLICSELKLDLVSQRLLLVAGLGLHLLELLSYVRMFRSIELDHEVFSLRVELIAKVEDSGPEVGSNTGFFDSISSGFFDD